ncbi:MAG: ribosome silencing factor [Christensenellales bacterium]
MDKHRELALAIAGVLDEKGAQDIQILRVDHLTSISDYFVIATGRNAQAVRALAEDVEERIEEKGVTVRRREGMNESRWIVLDYASVILHVFHPEEREFYNIERLWSDGTNQIVPEHA